MFKIFSTYICRTAPLTSKRFILYIYSTDIGTEYFKHGVNFPFVCLRNAVYFIIFTYLFPALFTFLYTGVLKLKKKIIPAPKGQCKHSFSVLGGNVVKLRAILTVDFKIKRN